MTCAAVVPLKLTVPAPGVKAAPLLIQSPATLIVVAVPAAKPPAVRVRSPVSVSVVVPPPALKAPAALSSVRLLNVCPAAEP